jgi:hypothetical protein
MEKERETYHVAREKALEIFSPLLKEMFQQNQ